jgi:predicted ATPase/DNA-binding SARP family transcriptional activator
MPNLSLFLLGAPQIQMDDVYIEIKPRKALALLIYLAVTAHHHARDALATLLWPDSDQQRARHALRSRLSELNLTLKGEWIEIDRESVGLRTGFHLDVTKFQHSLANAAADPQALSAAIALYRDDFLTGFSLLNCPEFDEWQFFQSEGLRQDLASALEKLVGILSHQAEYEAAVPYARRRLLLDPLYEPGHYQLMMLYAQAGQQAAALRQYSLCRQILHDELDVEPAVETTVLYNDIRAGKLRTIASIPAASQRTSARRSPAPNLPTQTSTFVGREDELIKIRRLLLEDPDCRLLNLCGPGGIGKTRLALAAAAQMLEAFRDGVYFVSLAPVGEIEDVVPTMADALHFTFFGATDPRVQLLDYLSQKQLLLVVDNFEHLLTEADVLSDIVRLAPEVRLLVTSRARLQLQEEWIYEVPGLGYPRAEDADTYLEEVQYGIQTSSFQEDTHSAVDLFLQRARQMSANFAPAADEMAAIGRICALVEGMPLALELAAPWTRTLSCQEIAVEIEHNLSFLTTTLRNMPERHRSLRMVFEQTWSRLPEEEKAVLQQLSIFRGGCTREAAEQVAGATLPLLSSLLDEALLRRTNTGRYEMHELIRQFAEAQLQRDPQVVDQVRQRHRAYFAAFLEVRTDGVKGPGQVATLAEIETNIDNVRLAWRGAVANQEVEAIEQSAECLFVYYLYRNGYDEGVLAFGRAVEAFGVRPDEAVEQGRLPDLAGAEHEQILIGFLLTCVGYFVAHRHDLQRGQKILEQALALIRRIAPAGSRSEAFALLWLAWALYFQGKLAASKQAGRESLKLLGDAIDRWTEAWILLVLGNSLNYERPAEAVIVQQKGLQLCEETGDQIVASYIYLNTGFASVSLGRYAQAQQHIDQAVAISQDLNNMLGLGYSLYSRGRLEIACGQYTRAIDTLQGSLMLFNKVGTVHASRAQTHLGMAHHMLGDLDQAQMWYEQALDGFETANSILDTPLCLYRLGRLAYDQGDLQQAAEYQRQNLARVEGIVLDTTTAAASWGYLGQTLAAMGEDHHSEARACFRQALELALAYELAPVALDVFVLVAQFLARLRNETFALEILALAEQHEASTFDTQERARVGGRRLSEQPPAEGFPSLDWRQMAQRLLETLSD